MPNDQADELDWNDLQTFLAVHDEGSVAAAARRLGVNHSTVLRRLAALESQLGARLFERLPQGYAPTAQGRELAARIDGIDRQIDAARRSVLGLDERISGSIRLTTTDTLAQGLLIPILADFHRLHPDVVIELNASNAFLSLTRREADVAVRGSNQPPGNLIGRHVGDIRTALYASRQWLDRQGPVTDPATAHWVAPGPTLAHLDQARWLSDHIPEACIVLRVDSLIGMVDAVAAGFGLGLLLCPLADARPELVRIATPDPAFDTQIWVLTHPELREVARIRALTRHLDAALRTDPRLNHQV